MTADTEHLLERVAAGDRAARDQLLQRHRRRLRRMVAVRFDPRLAARVDPSDVVQETTVSQAATTTTLAASANPAPVGQPLVLTVTVAPAFTGAGAPTGTVILRDGSNTLGFATLDSSGRAVFTFIPGQTIRNGRSRYTVL